MVSTIKFLAICFLHTYHSPLPIQIQFYYPTVLFVQIEMTIHFHLIQCIIILKTLLLPDNESVFKNRSQIC